MDNHETSQIKHETFIKTFKHSNLVVMTKKSLFTALLLISSYSLFAQTYIINVTIADVENHKLIPNQTVVITDDLISDIIPGKEETIPKNATVIDGSGKYLIPG